MARILIVDDSLLMRLKTKIILEQAQHEVIEATDGEDGLNKMMDQKPECVILDLLMPDMNGTDVLRKMQELNIDIPVIICTADIQDTTKQECLDLGIKAILNKPPPEAEVLEALKSICN